MRRTFLLATLGMEFGLSQVIELGRLDQYNAKSVRTMKSPLKKDLTNPKQTDKPKELDPNALWLSRSDKGYNMKPGSEVSKKIQGVLGGCGQFDAKCYNELDSAMKGVRVQTDPHIESRQLGVLLVLSALMVGFVSISAAHLTNRPNKVVPIDYGVFIPDQRASSFTAMTPGATATFSADGSAIATVTQPAPITSIHVCVLHGLTLLLPAKVLFR